MFVPSSDNDKNGTPTHANARTCTHRTQAEQVKREISNQTHARELRRRAEKTDRARHNTFLNQTHEAKRKSNPHTDLDRP